AAELSRHVPEGGVVLDLACGPARFLGCLLAGRPDLRAVGLDLSQAMLDRARDNLAEAGLSDRVTLVRADWTEADRAAPGAVDAVSCLSALHHCPTFADLSAVMAALARLRARDGAAVWLFDLVRPESETMLQLIPRSHEMASGKALPAAFKADWITSLRAGWTVEEMARAAQEAGLALTSAHANYSQLHYAPRAAGGADGASLWRGAPLPPADGERAEKMRAALGFA
ncbi:MAG: methyltransferase domain-containing protein, partial [Caulobacterales bacterium]|nr:methyltransferase domain-containing protein [Caulobacterales bacterium]